MLYVKAGAVKPIKRKPELEFIKTALRSFKREPEPESEPLK